MKNNFLKINNYSEEYVKKSFDRIADDLINKYSLKTGKTHINFIDFEFFYKCKNHQDVYTYNHKMPIEKLRAHKYGVDISLGFGDNGYGGILLRGIEMVNKKERVYIYKPHITRELFNALSTNSKYNFVKKNEQIKEYIKTIRILGNADTENKRKFKNAKYRYIVLCKRFWKDIKWKENLMRNSNLSEKEIKKFMGYTIKKY